MLTGPKHILEDPASSLKSSELFTVDDASGHVKMTSQAELGVEDAIPTT